MDKIIVETKTIDLDEIRQQAIDYNSMSDAITLIAEGDYPEEVLALIRNENEDRNFKKAHLKNEAKMKEDQILYYKSKEIK